MAVQFHVGYSATVKGAGVVAGGPYHCAKGSMVTAVTDCMNSPASINIDTLKQYVNSQSAKGIDDASNLSKSKAFIFAGSKDTVVNPEVGKHGANLYVDLGAQIKEVYTVPAQHSMVTNGFGNACDYKGEPYINNCNYDLAFEILNFLNGENLAKPVDMVEANLKQFDQTSYDSIDSFAEKGYMYVPEACNNGGCSVHVAFHGCQMGYETIGDKYVKHGGYNEVAEANNIIIIYPQVKASYYLPSNPNGCWDWWGYNDGYFTSADYDLQKGPQMKAVMQMVQDLGNGQTK